jgi:hypothetical protein
LEKIQFAPNPTNGQDFLITATDVSAGYVNGLGLLSFTAPAGETISQLASDLNSSLDSAGYLTSMPDATDIIIFGKGAGFPVEFDLLLDSLEAVGDRGISTTLLVFPVPEPASLLLVTSWLPALALMRRRGKSTQDCLLAT